MTTKTLKTIIALLNGNDIRTISDSEWRDIIFASRSSGVLARLFHCLSDMNYVDTLPPQMVAFQGTAHTSPMLKIVYRTCTQRHFHPTPPGAWALGAPTTNIQDKGAVAGLSTYLSSWKLDGSSKRRRQMRRREATRAGARRAAPGSAGSTARACSACT